MYFENLEKKIEDENKTAFDKLSDFLELDRTEESYRNTFLKLLGDVSIEEKNGSETKVYFGKLIDFLEIETFSTEDRNKFLELLNDYIEESSKK